MIPNRSSDPRLAAASERLATESYRSLTNKIKYYYANLHFPLPVSRRKRSLSWNCDRSTRTFKSRTIDYATIDLDESDEEGAVL